MNERVFLTARWTHLAMLNYEVDPAILAPHLPAGTELDDHEGRTFVSMVGFLYYDTRLMGWAVPWHQHFSEVNLRFYVRRLEGNELRRGVAFIKEIVPRRAVAWVARSIYEENFLALPMRYSMEPKPKLPDTPVPRSVAYSWRLRGQWQRLALSTAGATDLPPDGSEAQFIAEHYWGYTKHRDGGTSEYRVDHPPWRVTPATSAEFTCNVAQLYGEAFVAPLGQPPSSAFLAEGSPVVVYRGRRLPWQENARWRREDANGETAEPARATIA